MGIARAALLAIAITWLMSGCATTRSTIDVSVITTQQVPAKGFAKVLEVKDVRRFEATPRDPSIPSLQDSEEINDRAITSRAVARKRGGYGMAFAEILLPEGRTVEQIVREGATKALAEKGYAVVAEGSPEFAKALPVNIEIQQFWSWFTPGVFLVSVEFVGIVVLKGEVLAESNQETVRGYSIINAMAATDSQWQEVMQNGVQDLVEKMKTKLKSPN
jgi:hypothetical protein